MPKPAKSLYRLLLKGGMKVEKQHININPKETEYYVHITARSFYTIIRMPFWKGANAE